MSEKLNRVERVVHPDCLTCLAHQMHHHPIGAADRVEDFDEILDRHTPVRHHTHLIECMRPKP